MKACFIIEKPADDTAKPCSSCGGEEKEPSEQITICNKRATINPNDMLSLNLIWLRKSMAQRWELSAFFLLEYPSICIKD